MLQQKAKRVMLNRVLRLAGFVVVLVSFYFIGQRFWMVRAELSTLDVSRVWLPAAVGVLVYTGAGYLLAESWRRLLGWFGETKINWRTCYRIYAQSQIAKYLPGNVFHVGGRHLMGRKVEMEHVALAGAAFYEILGLISMGGSIALVSFVVFQSSNQVAFSVWFLLVGILAFPFVFNALAAKVSSLQRFRTAASARDVFRYLVPVYILYIIYFLVTGGILLGIVYSTSVIAPSEKLWAIPVVLSAFAVSWIAGWITPGAPAGVGVREVVLVSILATFTGEADSLMAALILRVVTLLGDFLFFLTSFVIREPHQ